MFEFYSSESLLDIRVRYQTSHKRLISVLIALSCLLSVVVVVEDGTPSCLVGATVASSHPGNLQQGYQNNENIYLESMEDLDHVAYLSLLNYNITDEALLQSSWLMNLGNPLSSHKQHQKTGPSAMSTTNNLRSHQAMKLESFIAHLRNGHLRRLTLDELESIVAGMNSTELNEIREQQQQQQQQQQDSFDSSQLDGNGRHHHHQNTTTAKNQQILSSNSLVDQVAHQRCKYLVTLYKHELLGRHRESQKQRATSSTAATSSTLPANAEPQSRVEYETIQNNDNKQHMINETRPHALNSSQQSVNTEPPLVIVATATTPASATTTTTTATTNTNQNDLIPLVVDTMRLGQLCRLAIGCHSADELVGLISKPWTTKQQLMNVESQSPSPASAIERESSSDNHGNMNQQTVNANENQQQQQQQQQPVATNAGPLDQKQQQENDRGSRRKNLRDSLSLSLAKLCPLILFQLHEDDGMCSVRRDDRPPMITVWAFATLFVTIVSFCSLIGLSLTPLLGETAAAETTSISSDSSGLCNPNLAPIQTITRPTSPYNQRAHYHQSQKQQRQHKASLTLFEGLAVGSLVGSALFSLIPQAFELQERESNQSFLLKAFIIFSGIYLFFCSERIMRIILDTRQRRKKKKLPRSSTTAAIELDHHHHHQHHQQQQLMPSSFFDQLTSGSRQWSQSQVSKRTSTDNQQQMKPIATKKPGPHGNMGASSRSTSHQSQSKAQLHGETSKSGGNVMRKKDSQVSKMAGSCNKLVMQPQQQQQQQHQQSASSARTHKPSGDGGNQRATTSRSSRRTRSKMRQHQSRRTLHNPPKSNKLLQAKRQQQQQQHREVESDCDYYPVHQLSTPSISSSSSSSSTCSSMDFIQTRMNAGIIPMGSCEANLSADESRVDCSSSSSSCSSSCSSASSCYLARTNQQRVGFNSSGHMSDSDKQARAVNKQISEMYSKRSDDHHGCRSSQHGQSRSSPTRETKFQFSDSQKFIDVDGGRLAAGVHPMKYVNPPYIQKQDISTVAWMIILGDGLHNFIDGISIGAAFSESILSGVSISVAVICEEFPHELGDFAVLVSSGMTVRQALGYNFLSACTCYFGMAVGIILGDVTDGASYISALAAGVFLYIALVDMMGELSATLEATSRDSIARTLKLLLLQNVGIFIGISIIFVLSFIDF